MIFDRRFKQPKPTETDLRYEQFDEWLSECPVEILDWDSVIGADGDYQDIRFSMEGLWNH